MNLYQLRDLIENSSAAEWVKVEPAGVTYRYRFEVSTDRDGGEQVSVDSHRAVAVYTADVNRKVDITGCTVVFDPGGPLSNAVWTKQRLAQATQALPNGYCGLPLQQSCPHANALLTELTGSTVWRGVA